MRLLIFGGTSEAHRLSDSLMEKGIVHTLSVATGYGEEILKEKSPLRRVLTGRMDDKEIAELILKEDFDFMIDATHPYAEEITGNIEAAVKKVKKLPGRSGIRAVRLVREPDESVRRRLNAYEKAYIHRDLCEAAEALRRESGNILLTTGSRDLRKFTDILGKDELDRLYVRVIPAAQSIRACEEAGIGTYHIIAMQGPFSRELNEALIREADIRHLVTKDSGAPGGTADKTEAAIASGISIHMISRPEDHTDMECLGYEEVLKMVTEAAEEECGTPAAFIEGVLPEDNKDSGDSGDSALSQISLIGLGMGDRGSMTEEALNTIGEADLIMGSERLIGICRRKFNKRAEYVTEYRPLETAEYIARRLEKQDARSRGISAAVLFSGDSGFYSGCRRVYEALERRVEEGLKAEIRICPGISSVAYLSARIGRPYDDAYILSVHGRGEDSIIKAAAHVRISRDSYLLMGGREDIKALARALLDAGLGDCIITAASELSSTDERIITGSAEGFSKGTVFKESDRGGALYICHIHNPAPFERAVAAGLKAGGFLRGKVPMTKEEVRAVTIDKLRLKPESRVLDIGCGTGSVSVETACLIPDGRVFAYDDNDEAVDLTGANVRKYKLPNVKVKKGCVPEIFKQGESFPRGITHVFIGGNKGRLRDILDFLKAKSESGGGIRVVLNMITDKTRESLRSWTDENEIGDYELVKIAVSRGDEMKAGNEVFICSFTM